MQTGDFLTHSTLGSMHASPRHTHRLLSYHVRCLNGHPHRYPRMNRSWGINARLVPAKELFTLLDLCVSSLRRGHANLLCIVPILTDDPRRESNNEGVQNLLVFTPETRRSGISKGNIGRYAKILPPVETTKERCIAEDGRQHERNTNVQICISRESNPGHIDGNDVFYH